MSLITSSKCFQLIKVEEGLMTGDVMFHEYIIKANVQDNAEEESSDDETVEEIKIEDSS